MIRRRLLWFLFSANLVVILLFAIQFYRSVFQKDLSTDLIPETKPVALHVALGSVPFVITFVFIGFQLRRDSERRMGIQTLDSGLLSSTDDDRGSF